MKTTSLLRWSLSLALGIPAAALALHASHAPLIALGATEAAGAILLQPRRTRLVGAVLLVVSLVAATAIHATLGEWPPLAFLVYLAAIAVVVRPC